MELSVIRLDSDEEKHIKIKVADILFFEYIKPNMFIHTIDASYRPPRGVEDWIQFIAEYGFSKLGRDNIVQISKVVRYDPKSRRAYFANGKFVFVTDKGEDILREKFY